MRIVRLLRHRPALDHGTQRSRVEMVELVATLAAGPDQAGRLQDLQVLRDGLSGRSQAVSHDQPGAELEERLAVALHEFVEDGSPRRVRQGPEDVRAGVTHAQDDMQVDTCLSTTARSLERQSIGWPSLGWPCPG
jgi:hypothetical protein